MNTTDARIHANRRGGWMRALPLRFSLRAFIIVCTVFSCVAGIYVSRIRQQTQFEYRNRYIGRYRIEAIWDKHADPPHLVLLLVYAPGNKRGGVGTSQPSATPVAKGISRIPKGLYVDGKQRSSAMDRVFLYLPKINDVVPIRLPQAEIDALELPEEFVQLEQSRLWLQFILPKLDSVLNENRSQCTIDG